MGCVICKPITATSAEDFCFSLFFPTYNGATLAADAQRETSRVDDPLKAPPLQRGSNTSRHVITSPERDRNGWPKWLSAAAGDAVSGWTPRRADSFEKLEKVRLLLISTRFINILFFNRSCQHHSTVCWKSGEVNYFIFCEFILVYGFSLYRINFGKNLFIFYMYIFFLLSLGFESSNPVFLFYLL